MNNTPNLRVSNYLDNSNYIISDELESSLYYEKLIKNEQTNNPNEQNVYLVMFSILDKEKGILVYNYMPYNFIFAPTLLYFISNRSNILRNVYKEPGFFLSVLDNSFNSKKELSDRLFLSKSNFDIDRMMQDITNLSTTQHFYEESFKLINKLTYFSSHAEMCSLLDLACKRKYKDFIKLILRDNMNDKYLELLNNVTHVPKISIISSCLFLVLDLDNFTNSLKNFNIDVNMGPQKLRGQVNSMNNFLSVLDIDYRKSLFNHNNLHTSIGTVSSRHKLDKSKFSFMNVHMNLGNIRWHSTKTKPSIVSDRLLAVSKVNNEESFVYNQLSEYFNKLPINNNSQLVIENFLLNYSNILNNEKIKNRELSPINYDLLSSSFTNLLKEKELLITKYFDNIKNREYNKKPTRKKDLALYHMSQIFKSTKSSYITSLINGRMLSIVNVNYKLDNKESLICLDLGRDLVKHYHYNLYTEHKNTMDRYSKSKYTLLDWKNDNNTILNEFNKDDDQFTGYIGGSLINLMVDIDLIEIQWLKIGRFESYNVLIPTKEVTSTLRDVKNTLNLPQKMPMIVKPKPYKREVIEGVTKEILGGYLLNDEKYTDELIIPKWNLKEPSIIKDKNLIYSLVNNINSIGFKINREVLKFIDEYSTEYGLLEDKDFSKEMELLSKTKLNKAEYSKLESYLSKKKLESNILGLARSYSNLHEFFLPVRIDYRGRLYCVSEYLNYQSNELAKSLLLFSKPEYMNKSDIIAINYMKAYGANCFGNKLDKKSWNDRVSWVDNNIDNIISFKNGKLIKQSENKLLFAAFCFEFNRFLSSLNNNDNPTFETYLPIRLDASCNGYQHLALLSLDFNLAKELNLTKSTWYDQPKDFYSYMGVCMIGLYDKKLKTNLSNEERDSYNRLIKLDILRAMLKKAILTNAYNISPLSMIKDMQENFELCNSSEKIDILDRWYRLKENHNVKLKGRDFIMIKSGIEEVLSNDDFKLKKLMKYLNNLAKVLTKLNLVISWGSPSGIEVNQSFLSTEEVRLKPFSFSRKSFTLTVPDKKKKFNKSKQIRAFMPNLVHSLDAASLALLVDLYFNSSDRINNTNNGNIKNIFSVHDCFAVTANNVDNIMDLLKLVYIKIYSQSNYLRKLDRGIKDFIKLSYGDDCFNEKTLEITTKDKDEKLIFPSIEGVLGTDASAADFISDSSYIAH